ncbi:MAG TPA: hypothetical protein VI776_14110 [Anaerolineales bacterium]|nr:hypothetical protein [Anaerolineales bacterium]
MKENLSWRTLLIVGISAVLLLTAAAPYPGRPGGASIVGKSDLVRLTVDNRTNGTIYVTLEGLAFYYMVIGPGDIEEFTVLRGTYDQWVTACADTAKEEDVEITKTTRMIMPICGANANQAERSGSAIDLSDLIKIVDITIENDSGTNLLAILTGPATYVFTFKKGEEKDYTVARGSYSVQYYACGRSATRSFHADKGKVLELKCPR